VEKKGLIHHAMDQTTVKSNSNLRSISNDFYYNVVILRELNLYITNYRAVMYIKIRGDIVVPFDVIINRLIIMG